MATYSSLPNKLVSAANGVNYAYRDTGSIEQMARDAIALLTAMGSAGSISSGSGLSQIAAKEHCPRGKSPNGACRPYRTIRPGMASTSPPHLVALVYGLAVRSFRGLVP